MGKNKSKSVTLDQAQEWLKEHGDAVQRTVDEAINRQKEESSCLGRRSLATKMSVSRVEACVLQDSSRGLAFEISYGGKAFRVEERLLRSKAGAGQANDFINKLARRIPKSIYILWEMLTGAMRDSENKKSKKQLALARNLFEQEIEIQWAKTNLVGEYDVKGSGSNGSAAVSRFGLKLFNTGALGKEQIAEAIKAVTPEKPSELAGDAHTDNTSPAAQIEDMDIDDVIEKAAARAQKENEVLLPESAKRDIRQYAAEVIKHAEDLIASGGESIKCGGWVLTNQVPRLTTSNEALRSALNIASQKIQSIASAPAGMFSHNDTIMRQPSASPEQISCSVLFSGDTIVRYFSHSGEVIVQVPSKEENDRDAAASSKCQEADNAEHHSTRSVSEFSLMFPVEVIRNDKEPEHPPKTLSKAIKASEKLLKELDKSGFQLIRNTGAGLVTGKGDYTLRNKKSGKCLRASLKSKNPERDFQGWETGVREFIDKMQSSFDEETSKADYASTIEALKYIHNFVERDIADILSHVEYMAVESLAPYLSGEKYVSSYPPYRPDLYDAKYKGFYTRSEIEDIIADMDKRNVIRTRWVDYKNHAYTRVNSLKASRKADILSEKRYQFPLDELLIKCKDKESILDDFECEFLFLELERRAAATDSVHCAGGTANGGLSIPDYLMLMKMLKNPPFIAEYKQRYAALMAGAPEMFATLLKVEADQQIKPGMTHVCSNILKKMGANDNACDPNLAASAGEPYDLASDNSKSNEYELHAGDSENESQAPQQANDPVKRDKKPKHKAVKSDSLSSYNDIRYVIIDEDGVILDDAQGYGYKSPQKAYAGWRYKNRTPEEKKTNNKIHEWLRKNKAVCARIEDMQWYAMKDREQVTGKDVEKLLATMSIAGELKGDIPSSGAKILQVFGRM